MHDSLKAPQPGRRYLLVTPCRDEAAFARRTLDSIVAQAERPTKWVIVDDGSTDDTPEILSQYAAQNNWIEIVTRADRGDRKLGGGVVDAFYDGYRIVEPNDFDYVTKLDLDLDLPESYFEELMNRMEANPRLGSCSGKPFFRQGSEVIYEPCGDEMSVGMCKFYRTECFEEIGGFVRELMWDGIDCHRSRMLGWMARSWNDPRINFEHLRPMGTSHKSWWVGRTRHGFGQWYMGTSFPYLLASAATRLAKPPVVIGSLAMIWGYLKAALARKPRYPDRDLQKFVRRYQRSILLHGKERATARLEQGQEAVWRAKHTRTAL